MKNESFKGKNYHVKDFSEYVDNKEKLDTYNNLYLGYSFEVFYYNNQTLTTNEISLPQSLDDFTSFINNLSNIDATKIPLFIRNYTRFIISVSLKYGIDYYSYENKDEFYNNNETVINIINQVKELKENNLITFNDKDDYLIAYDESYNYNYYKNMKDLPDCLLMPNYSYKYNNYYVHDISLTHYLYIPKICNEITKEFCKDENLNRYIKDNCLFGVVDESLIENMNSCYNTLTNTQNIIHTTYSSNFLNEFNGYEEN